MAKTTCKYHPRVAARWRCPSCDTNVCPQCVTRAGPRSSQPLCASCRSELESLGIGNTIPPFWERIPSFFAYPLKPDALIFLGILSVTSLAVFLPLVGIFIYLVVIYALLKYGYLVLSHTADGHLTPPQLAGTGLAGQNNLPLKQLAVFILMGLATIGLGFLGQFAFVAGVLFLLFTLPASVMALAVSHSAFKAMNPATLVGIIRAIGWPYAILYVFLLLLSGGSDVATQLVAPLLPVWLLIVIGVFISGYFTTVMFHMMGYAVYQYHEPLGYGRVKEFDASEAQHAPTQAPTVDPFLNEVHILVTEGKVDEARQRLKDRIRAGGSLDERAQYHKLLKLSADKDELINHGGDYVKMLVGLDKREQALDTFADCMAADSKCHMWSGELAYDFAGRAHGQGRHDLALGLLNGFAKHYAEHKLIPQAYLLAARILCEQKGQDAQARKLLTDLLRRYPNHEATPEIERYLGFLDRLGGASKATSPA